MKASALNSYKYPSSYDQPSADLIKCPLLKSPDFHSHASQFTKHFSFMTLEGDTLLQIQKYWDSILYAFWKYLTANKSCPPYKSLLLEHNNISKFLFPPDTHPKFSTAKENYEALSRALIVHLAKYTTISSSKAPKSHVKLITYMNNYNWFDLLIDFFFIMSPQWGGLGPKYQYLVISLWLGEGETLPQLRLRALWIRSEIFLFWD